MSNAVLWLFLGGAMGFVFGACAMRSAWKAAAKRCMFEISVAVYRCEPLKPSDHQP